MEYFHGGDIYRNKVEYDFSVNINPLGMPAVSLEAAVEAIKMSGAYPDPEGEELRQAVSRVEKAAEERIILGNGAAELIYALCRAIPKASALTTAPSFQEYERAVSATGGSMSFFPLRKENGFALTEDILEEIGEGTDLFFLCNPNNPTGSMTQRDLLEKIAGRCEDTGTCFCLDECFLPFSCEEAGITMKHFLGRFPHMIILRAFTKIYGMPGLRLGYGMSADTSLLKRMRESMQPWNTSLPAQRAGIAALGDTDYLERTRELIREQRQYLYEELSRGIADEIYDSEVNFLFFHSREDLCEKMLEQKILIRSCENYRNLEKGYFRVGVRLAEENRELIRRMRRC